MVVGRVRETALNQNLPPFAILSRPIAVGLFTRALDNVMMVVPLKGSSSFGAGALLAQRASRTCPAHNIVFDCAASRVVSTRLKFFSRRTQISVPLALIFKCTVWKNAERVFFLST